VVSDLESIFPGLRGTAYRVTSPADDLYNCIAWAAGDPTRWWPDPFGRDYWPPAIPRAETVDAFRAMFRSLGYTECPGEDREPGFEKVALFATPQQFPTHAARQLPGGEWSSKVGELENIEHGLRHLEGDQYGTVVQVMKRPLPGG
jgi:hypothetical protein